MARNTNTREVWLKRAVEKLRPVFDEQGAKPYPNIRVSCGWPRGSAKAIGQAWAPQSSKDKHVEIFISPEMDNPVRVLDILAHELIHAIVGNEAGHKGPFRSLATAIGLTGRMTATVAGPELEERLQGIALKLGPYPHARLEKMTKIGKQPTRMLKVECTNPECECIVRMTKKHLDSVGPPVCGCGHHMEQEEKD